MFCGKSDKFWFDIRTFVYNLGSPTAIVVIVGTLLRPRIQLVDLPRIACTENRRQFNISHIINSMVYY